jgi:hypothetical protein
MIAAATCDESADVQPAGSCRGARGTAMTRSTGPGGLSLSAPESALASDRHRDDRSPSAPQTCSLCPTRLDTAFRKCGPMLRATSSCESRRLRKALRSGRIASGLGTTRSTTDASACCPLIKLCCERSPDTQGTSTWSTDNRSSCGPLSKRNRTLGMEQIQFNSERVLQLLRDLDFRSHSDEDCARRDELLIQLSRQESPERSWDPRDN